MEDSRIIALFQARNEQALEETSVKYGAYLSKIARNILGNREDTEECVNDSLLRVWNSIPPNEPKNLSVYLALITRETAINAYRKKQRKKRADSEYACSYEELSDILPDGKDGPEEAADRLVFAGLLNQYLASRPKDVRTALIMRYFYLDSVRDIARVTDSSEARIKTMLHRERKSLRSFLEKEGYEL